MRRVATELGVGTMSLYRYVASKEDLLDLAFDAAYGELTLPAAPPGDWRAGMRWLAHTMRDLLRRHPWTTTVLATRPPLGPNYLRYFEFTLAVAAPKSKDMTHAARLVGTLQAFVLGSITYELAEAEADRRTGLTEEQKRAAAGPYLDGLLASGSFPYLAQFLTEGIDTDYDRSFEFGLECVLDGLTASTNADESAGGRGRRSAPSPKGQRKP
jgi:AcrR family transcriptional regulator